VLINVCSTSNESGKKKRAKQRRDVAVIGAGKKTAQVINRTSVSAIGRYYPMEFEFGGFEDCTARISLCVKTSIKESYFNRMAIEANISHAS